MNSHITESSFSDNTFKNLITIYFDPEIDRRKKVSLIPENFELLAAQALIFPDDRKNIIRLNDEVCAKVKLKEGVNHSASDFFPNAEDIESIDINEDEYLDCGHIIIIRFKNCFQLKFDFIYNKKRCNALLKNSLEFLATAKFALENDYLNSFIDNAFSAFELLAKANLLLEANKSVQGKTNHKAVNTNFNLRFKNSLLQEEVDLRQIFNKLSEERRNARYLDSSVSFTREELEISLKKIENYSLKMRMQIDV